MQDSYGTLGAQDAEVAAIRAIYDAFARRDVEGALAYVAEDVEFMPEGTARRTGRTAPYRGHAGIREYFADAARVWDDLRLHADDVRAIAGSVVVFGRVTAVLNGEPFERSVIWNWKVRGGKATAMRVNTLGEAI